MFVLWLCCGVLFLDIKKYLKTQKKHTQNVCDPKTTDERMKRISTIAALKHDYFSAIHKKRKVIMTAADSIIHIPTEIDKMDLETIATQMCEQIDYYANQSQMLEQQMQQESAANPGFIITNSKNETNKDASDLPPIPALPNTKTVIINAEDHQPPTQTFQPMDMETGCFQQQQPF